jgi:hypothetical protein
MRLIVAGESPRLNEAMLSRLTIPSRDDGTGNPAIASVELRLISSARKCTSYCSPASLNVVT